MNNKEKFLWLSFGNSLIEHNIITREQSDYKYTYYLFDKIKIYSKKIHLSSNSKPIEYKYKVSVIVPVYNVEQYIERCLNSIINQSLKNIEIICINDGSTDSSLSKLEKYREIDNRIKIINQENQGLSAARNNGLKIANGEYVGYVDSDDWISSNFFELLYNNAKKYNADIACGEIKRINNDYLEKDFFVIKKKKISKKSRIKFNLCNIPKYNYVSNKIYRKDALISSRIEFPKGRNFEDIVWTPRVVNKLGALVTVPNAIYYYFVNNNSITEVFDDKSKKDFFYAVNDAVSYIVDNKIKCNMNSYTAKSRKKYVLLGITILDIKKWDSMTLYRFLGIPIFISYRINN